MKKCLFLIILLNIITFSIGAEALTVTEPRPKIKIPPIERPGKNTALMRRAEQARVQMKSPWLRMSRLALEMKREREIIKLPYEINTSFQKEADKPPLQILKDLKTFKFKDMEIQVKYNKVMEFMLTNYFTEKKPEEYTEGALNMLKFLEQNYKFKFYLATKWIKEPDKPESIPLFKNGEPNPDAQEYTPESGRDLFFAGKAILSFHPDLLKALSKWQPIDVYIGTKSTGITSNMCGSDGATACFSPLGHAIRIRSNTNFSEVTHEMAHYVHLTLIDKVEKDDAGEYTVPGYSDKYSIIQHPSQEDPENPLKGKRVEFYDIFDKDLPANPSDPYESKNVAEPPDGFMTFYSLTHCNENFADHVMYYMSYPTEFKERAYEEIAGDEDTGSNKLLWQKWLFIKFYFFGNIIDLSKVDTKIAVKVKKIADLGNGDGVITAGEPFTVELFMRPLMNTMLGWANFIPFAKFEMVGYTKEVKIPEDNKTTFPIIADTSQIQFAGVCANLS